MSYQWPERFWPHQTQGCNDVAAAIDSGCKRIILTSPTGGGKSAIMTALIEWATSQWQNSALYTNRRLLFDQTSKVLEADGVEHGLRAAGHAPALFRAVQLCMTPSEYQAVFKKERRQLHDAKLVLLDEIHMQGGEMMMEIVNRHLAGGAAVVGVTATPIDLPGEWDQLVVAGNNSQLMKCGALVPATSYCPDFPDLKHIKNYRVGEDLTDGENRKVMMRPGVFGRVLKHWLKLNPERKPTILFAPDVAGSVYFAQEFHKAGVRSAHIDAKHVWHNGDFVDGGEDERHRILEMTKTGEVEVICNRFVLREGINLPHLEYGILACVFGSMKSYIQSVGRVLRASTGVEGIVIQDHGGNVVRHGSPNEDRIWKLGMRGYKETGIRQEAMRERPELEPIVCPQCHASRMSGPTCPVCGYSCHKRSRLVVQIDGALKCVDGPTHRKRYTKLKPETERLWKSMYFRSKSERWDGTFNQARALFFREQGYYPPENLPLMPVEPGDWFEKVRHVPVERLI